MRLLNTIDSIERRLSAEVLSRVEDLGAVYGCGPIEGAEDFDALLHAFQLGELRGVIGLQLTEGVVARYPSEVRANNIGVFLNLGSRVVMADQQSFEWAPHLALKNVEPGTYVAWAAAAQACQAVIDDHDEQHDDRMIHVDELAVRLDTRHPGFQWLNTERAPVLVVVNDVGVAIAAAILDRPCLLYATHSWGSIANREFALLTRWAREANVTANLCWDLETLDRKVRSNDIQHVSRELVAARRQQVDNLLCRLMTQQADPLAAALGAAPTASVGGGRVMEIGSVFDETTHYDDDYYGGGRGIRYYLPDGKLETYHSTAYDWDGFRHVAAWLRTLVEERQTLLDLGCGAGGFVKHALAAGFDAYGVDISSRAIARAETSLSGRLRVDDITKSAAQQQASSFDIVTAWDVWEHIFAPDVDGLIAAVQALLKPNGLGVFCICTRSIAEKDWTIERGARVTLENSWLLVSGHVTIRRWGWWAARFKEYGLQTRLDLCQLFQLKRAEEPTMRGADSWSARHVIFVEKS